MSMDKKLIKNVLKHVDQGHKVLFRVDHLGGVHIKIKHGPFNALTLRYETDQENFAAIKEQLPSGAGVRRTTAA